MTTDEAMQAVKKAVELIEKGEDEWPFGTIDHAGVEGMLCDPDAFDIILAALRAIAPDGPLVCVPRHLPHQPRMDGHCDVCGCQLPEKGVAWAGEPNNRFYYCPDHWPKTLRRALNGE